MAAVSNAFIPVVAPLARSIQSRCAKLGAVSHSTARHSAARRARFGTAAGAAATMGAELISPAEAHRRKTDDAVAWKHVDVRSEREYAQGHPKNSVNVPFLSFNALGVPSRNPAFLDTIQERYRNTDALIISCQSGKRSAMAVTALKDAGFEKLADVEGGYNAWTQDASLPVEN
jgi:rhodanese-related sulfurtransferase